MQWFDSFNPQFPTEKAARLSLNLIEHFELHREPTEAIDTSPLLNKFDLRFMELPESTCGFTLDVERKIIIALNHSLTTELTRYVAMHEVGHVACWHPNQLNACEEGRFVYNQLETEATTVAAYLLVPEAAVLRPVLPILKAIANHYAVPPELVRIRRHLYLKHGF
jgi:Zn-dependent peptidase ImmA (M78 family)